MRSFFYIIAVGLTFLLFIGATPDDDPTILLHLNPEEEVYNSDDDPAEIGEVVYEWHDVSDNGFVFENNKNERRPILAEDDGFTYLDFTPGDLLENSGVKTVLNGMEEFSLFIVVKSDDTETDQGFFDTEDPDGRDDLLSLRYDKQGANTSRTDLLKGSLHSNDKEQQVETQSSTQTTDRQVLAMTWEKGGKLKVYVDGELSETADNSFGNDLEDFQKVIIGKGPKDTGNDKGWDGKIGSVILYDQIMDAEMILALSDQLMGEGSSTLPVELVFFDYEMDDDGIYLEWATSAEINNDYFEVQRSINGLEFETIAQVPGNGNSNEYIEYSYDDYDNLKGTIYYRLKQNDYDGQFEYSNILAVSLPVKESACKMTIAPNPCIGRCTVKLEDCDDINGERISLNVFDAFGNVVNAQSPTVIEQGEAMFSFNSGNNLSPGVYIIKATTMNKQIEDKVVLN